METPFGTGCHESIQDPRTVQHSDLTQAGAPLVKGGYDYLPSDIEMQYSAGICTGISEEQQRRKANGKKYSADFHYLLQKKFIDKNWIEGSSILSSLKVGNKFGFLPLEQWKYTTEVDRNLGYANYVAKLQAIPDDEINRLLTLCIDKIAGYSQVDVSDPQKIAHAIDQSDAGILCRYDLGKEWWTVPINPLRPPQTIVSGHAIIMCKYDYTNSFMQTLANTWSPSWANNGCADVNWTTYKPTEAWIILSYSVIKKQLPPTSTPTFIQNIVDMIFKWFSSKN